jgi:hypothetical protein
MLLKRFICNIEHVLYIDHPATRSSGEISKKPFIAFLPPARLEPE